MANPMVNSTCTNKLTSFSPYNDDEGQRRNLFKKIFYGDTIPVSSQFRISGSCNDLLERNSNNSTTADDQSSSEAREEPPIFPSMGITGMLDAASLENNYVVPQKSLLSSPSSGRNLYNVLSGLKRIIAVKGKTPQAYRDCDFKQYWMPDSNCKECYECGCKFSLFRRRHHCRICGQIFCSSCCSQEVPGKTIGYTGSLRCCDYCMKVVNQYIPETDMADLPDTHVPQWNSHLDDSQSYLAVDSEDLRRGNASDVHGINGTPSYNGILRRGSTLKPSIFDDDKKRSKSSVELDASPLGSLQKERKALLQESCHLHDLWFSMRTSISMQSVRYILKTYDNCIQANQIVNWLIDNDKAMSREQAVVLGQALLDGNWLESLDGKVIFKDNPRVFYRPTEMALKSRQDDMNAHVNQRGGVSSESDGEPLWVQEILRREDEFPEFVDVAKSIAKAEQSGSDLHQDEATNSLPPPELQPTLCLNLDVSKEGDVAGRKDNNAEDFSVNTKVEEADPEPPLAQSRPPQDSMELSMTNDNKEKLRAVFHDHLTRLTYQLLKKNQLNTTWAEWVSAIGRVVTNNVRPNARLEDEMDIRHYVKFKKMEGGDRSQWQMVNGVVFSKNVSHKKDRRTINNPRILLLSAPIEYQRIENKMSSLEPQILQEREFLKKCVHRIITMRPDVLLVEKSVSRIAREYLHEAGITLVINVKQSVMQRISRMTQATVVSSIDELVNKTNLGTCRQFCLHAYSQNDGTLKTLMFLDGCCSSLGCSVILRGATLQELQRVKSVLKFLIYSMYHLNLEMSFLMDENAYLAKSIYPVNDDVSQVKGCLNERNAAIQGEVNHNDGSCADKENSIQVHENVPVDAFKSSRTLHDIHLRELKFKNCISKEVILSISPLVCFDLPYLETAESHLSPLRAFFTKEDLYWSEELGGGGSNPDCNGKCDRIANNANISCTKADCNDHKSDIDPASVANKAFHPFTSQSLQSSAGRSIVQNLLADFRARGGKPLPETDSESIFKKKFSTPSPQEAPTRSATKHQFDCLALENHQKISVLFSSISLESPNFPSPCVLPWTVTMTFYSQTDITLGGFLEKFCYNEGYRCVNTRCDIPMRDHVRRFIHGTGCIQVTLKKVEPQSLASNQTSGIKLWSYCKLCLQKTPVSLLSSETYCLSFGKYLELRFYGSDYINRPGSKCNHSLHKDYVQIFDCGSVRAAFKYSPITILNICLPPMIINSLSLRFSPDTLHKEGIMLYYTVEYLFDSIMENLSKLKREAVNNDGQNLILTQHIIQLEMERQSMDQKVEYVISMVKNLKQLKAEVDDSKAQSSLGLQISDAYVGLHRNISSTCQVWTDKLMELETILKKSSKILSSSVTSNSINNSQQSSCTVTSNHLIQNCANVKGTTSESVDIITDSSTIDCSNSNIGGSIIALVNNSLDRVASIGLKKVSSYPIGLVDCNKICRETRSSEELMVLPNAPLPVSVFRSEGSAPSFASFRKDVSEKEASLDEVCHPGGVTTSLSSQTHHERDNVAIDTDANEQSDINDINESQEIPNPATCAHSDVFATSLADSKKEGKADVLASLVTDVSNSGMENIQVSALKPGLKKMKYSASSKESSMGEASGQSKVNMKQIFSSFLSNSNSCSVNDPIPPDEHHLLPECYKVPIVIYDKEPSSIIAYALSSKEYSVKMSELGIMEDETNPKKLTKNGEIDEVRNPIAKLSFMNTREKSPGPLDLLQTSDKLRNDLNSFDMVRYVHQDSDSIEDRESMSEEPFVSSPMTLRTQRPHHKHEPQTRSQQQTSQQHIKLQFSDATTKFYCEICYAKQFDDLRKLVYQDGEERFIRSLSRCVTWFARGGKSGSNFCKTKDNRFILKQMSLKEVQSFSTFAPNYFNYILDCLETGRPTTVAKIVGVFKIVFQNSRTTETVSQDLIVMENLFYNRHISKIYDLKGSMRNRMVDTLGKSYEDIVLLDENLIRAMVDSPLYVHSHAKLVLMSSITRDAEFLANNLVMDYSLLVGLDECNQLVVGIIDYLRTFTWDKRVEMIFKTTYGSKMPTVVSPEIYRRRFLDAMDRYFLAVPDKWKGLGRSLSEALL